MRITSIFLFNTSIKRSFSQVIFCSSSFFKYFIVRQGFKLLTDSYFSIAFSSLFAFFIRFCIFYPVARPLFNIVRSSAKLGHSTIISLQSNINEYIFSKIYYVIKSFKLGDMIIKSIMNIFFNNYLIETPSSLIAIRLYLSKNSSRSLTLISLSYI